jgi:hypothetical protein
MRGLRWWLIFLGDVALIVPTVLVATLGGAVLYSVLALCEDIRFAWRRPTQ